MILNIFVMGCSKKDQKKVRSQHTSSKLFPFPLDLFNYSRTSRVVEFIFVMLFDSWFLCFSLYVSYGIVLKMITSLAF